MKNTSEATSELQQLVVFKLENESYGVNIGMVNEIIRLQQVTKMPRSPKFVEGMINLRGKVIPVVSLRTIFCLPAAAETSESRIVVIEINGQQTGIMVDTVTEVLRIPSDAIEPPSTVISGTDSECITGIAKLEDRMITLLDLERIFTSEQEKQFSQVEFEQPEVLEYQPAGS